ncbi:MAG: hypothetical protein ACK5ZX_03190 [Bacteroidota bacterium]
MKKTILFLVLCFTFTFSFGQRALNQEVKLVDGLYLNMNEFKKDAPSLLWKEYEVIWTYNTKLKCYQVENIYKKGNPQLSIHDSVWGFTIKGIPYIRISTDSSGRPLTLFTELTLRGMINIFSYEKETEELFPMKAYNPLTGTVFRKGVVKRNITTIERRIFNLKDDLIIPYDKEVLEQWMEKDKEILRALRFASEEEYEEKLTRALIVFNGRYPFIIQK